MDHDTEIFGPGGRFKTTAWDIVRSAVDPEAQDLLIRIYWKPLYIFVRTRGFDNETAKDIIQDFFVALLERKVLGRADPSKGRFRAFLLTILKNFLADWKKSANRERRGGLVRIHSMDFSGSDVELAGQLSKGESVERAVDRAWARSLLDECIGGLDAPGSHIQALRLRMTGEPYAKVTAVTGLSESAAQVAVHRLAARLGEELRKRLMIFVRSKEELEAEVAEFTELLSDSR
jgi:RNA polymerase sigma-70 factor (ECF subfamily)